MRPFLVKRHIFTVLAAAFLVFSLVTPPFIQACGCACAPEDKPGSARNRTTDPPDLLIPACCCPGGCAPEPDSDTLFAGADDMHACDTDPVCCCDAGTGPPPAVNDILLKNDRRPSTQESSFQAALPSAFMPRIEHSAFRSIPVIDRNTAQVSIHISSTVLLL